MGETEQFQDRSSSFLCCCLRLKGSSAFADHVEDADIDEPLLVAPELEKSNLSKEEKQILLDEKLAKLRAVSPVLFCTARASRPYRH